MFFSKKKVCVIAACAGRCLPMGEIPDEAFAQGLLGIGVGIEPTEGHFCAPVNGVIQSVADTGHAYTILSDEGLDLLVHIGVDTVSMKGEGFFPRVRTGDRVQIGDVIADADLDVIRERGLSTVTAVLITESERIENVEFQYGNVVGGIDAVMHFSIKKKG